MRITTTQELTARALAALGACGVHLTSNLDAPTLQCRSPITGEALLEVNPTSATDVASAIATAHASQLVWRTVPAPRRGLVIKRLGTLITEHKEDLATLITIEVGKIPSEALGEVQEMIDICDLAVGLSRQIGGVTLPSERVEHRLMEQWHPLGVVGVITAFNFPAAVWAWNAALALVCGDTIVWKPSEMTPLTALACSALLSRAAEETGAPAGLNVTVLGDATTATPLLDSPLIPLVSATGSERMGRQIAPRVAARLGRTILELGGNNAGIVARTADLDSTIASITFAAAGTTGQRCTTMRRLIVHEDVVDELVERLRETFEKLPVGDPFMEGTLVGPLIGKSAYAEMCQALDDAVCSGGTLIAGGGRICADSHPDSYYVCPALVRMPGQSSAVERETFAPILYVLSYQTDDEAIALHNGVAQGLSSSIYTSDHRQAERFMAADGSDCGIVNVNIGTSGAEIGGAFGGEKATGGGREAGSDAWKAYMRRATNTISYSSAGLLAQGVRFI